MAKVAFAFGATHFGTDHAVARIDVLAHRLLVHRPGKARPAAPAPVTGEAARLAKRPGGCNAAAGPLRRRSGFGRSERDRELVTAGRDVDFGAVEAGARTRRKGPGGRRDRPLIDHLSGPG